MECSVELGADVHCVVVVLVVYAPLNAEDLPEAPEVLYAEQTAVPIDLCVDWESELVEDGPET